MNTFLARVFSFLVFIVTTTHGISLGEEAAAAATPDPFATLIRLVASMVVVLGLIVGAAFFGRKLFARMRLGVGPARLMQIRQAINIGGKKQIVLLEIGPSVLVVGTSADSVRLLAKLPKRECEPPAGATATLGETFENAMQAVQGTGVQGAGAQTGPHDAADGGAM